MSTTEFLTSWTILFVPKTYKEETERRGSEPKKRWLNFVLNSLDRKWHVKLTFQGILQSANDSFAKVAKRRNDLENLCLSIDFQSTRLLDDTVTELLLTREHDTHRQKLCLKTPLEMRSEYAVIHDLWLRIQEDPSRVRYPVYNGCGTCVPARDLSAIKKTKEFRMGVHLVHVDCEDYVYKEVNRPLYIPNDSEALEIELRNLERMRGHDGVVQLIAAVVSHNPYRSTKPIGGDPPTSLQGILLEYGPLTEARLWEGERATIKLDRGSTPLSYMESMGINEIKWAKAHAKPQINTYRSIDIPVSPNDYISLLNRYLQVAPHLSPGPFRTSLSHPDLHLDNIFVDPKKITCIIDWQSASVSEPFFQQRIPRMLLPVDRRSSKTQLETMAEEPEPVEGLNEAADLLRHYQNLSKLKNESRWAAVNLHNRNLMMEPLTLLCGAWSRNDVFSFRHASIHLASRWNEIAPDTTPCPLQFTDHELQLHNSELELVEGLGEVLYQLQKDELIPLGGMVLREGYERALHVNKVVREMFVDMANSETQKVLYSRIWPYQA